GGQTTVRLKLVNIGGAATKGRIGLGGMIPEGTSIANVSGGTAWQCTGGTTPTPTPQSFACTTTADTASIAPRRALVVLIVLKVAADAHPGQGEVTLSALADNEIAAAKPRATTLPLLILEANAGFPALSVFHATGTASLVPA